MLSFLSDPPPGLLLLLLAHAAERVVNCWHDNVAVWHIHQSAAGLLLEADGPNFARCTACCCGIAPAPRSVWRLVWYWRIVMRHDLEPVPNNHSRPDRVKDRGGEICGATDPRVA